MFQTKKSKIRAYLQPLTAPTAFDTLLSDAVEGRLKARLDSFGTRHTRIHIDWLPDYRCIGIQTQCDRFYLNIQIEPTVYIAAIGTDEPGEGTEFPLVTADEFYRDLEDGFARLID